MLSCEVNNNMHECNLQKPNLKNDFKIEKAEQGKTFILSTPYKKYRINDLCCQVILKMDGTHSFEEIADSIAYSCSPDKIERMYQEQFSKIGIAKGSTYEKKKGNGFLLWKKKLFHMKFRNGSRYVNFMFHPMIVLLLIGMDVLFSLSIVKSYAGKNKLLSFDAVMANQFASIVPMLFFYISLFIHELGHYFCCYQQKGVPGEIGIGTYFIMPVLYTNLDDIWKLSKKKRIWINLAGIYFQNIFLFLCEMIAWVRADAAAVTFFFYAQLATLANLIPFIKMDGYWILVDLLEYPNLFRDTAKSFLAHSKFRKNNLEISSIRPRKLLRIYETGFWIFMLGFGGYLIYYFMFTLASILSRLYNRCNWQGIEYVLIKMAVLFFVYDRIIRVIRKDGKSG